MPKNMVERIRAADVSPVVRFALPQKVSPNKTTIKLTTDDFSFYIPE